MRSYVNQAVKSDFKKASVYFELGRKSHPYPHSLTDTLTNYRFLSDNVETTKTTQAF